MSYVFTSNAVIFTTFQALWIVLWAIKHLEIRRNRNYRLRRTLAVTNRRYKILSLFLFAQNILCIGFFWFHDPLLLKFHDSDAVRFLAMPLQTFATVLYFWALRHLGPNYSPCYDSYLPKDLTMSGPYRWVRHPMYLAKILIGVSQLLLIGSYWYLPSVVYFLFDTFKALVLEEHTLASHIPGYIAYQKRTFKIVPFIS